MKLLPQPILDMLLANGKCHHPLQGELRENDFWPVVKLFNPCGAGTWLLTEIEPETDDDIAWGLCDLGFGCPEFGTVSIKEIASYRGPLNLGIERDLHWKAHGPISAYIAAADKAGHIVQLAETAEDVLGQ